MTEFTTVPYTSTRIEREGDSIIGFVNHGDEDIEAVFNGAVPLKLSAHSETLLESPVSMICMPFTTFTIESEVSLKNIGIMYATYDTPTRRKMVLDLKSAIL